MHEVTLERRPVDRAKLRRTGAPALDPTVDEPTMIRDAETGDPAVVIAPFPGDIGAYRWAAIHIPQNTIVRAGGVRNRSRNFGYSARTIVKKNNCCRSSLAARLAPEAHTIIEDTADELADSLAAILPERVAGDVETTRTQVLPDWCMGDRSPWTSGVLNDTSPMPYHTDGNNLPVWSAMVVCRRAVRGGHLHVPEYDAVLACRVRRGDPRAVVLDRPGDRPGADAGLSGHGRARHPGPVGRMNESTSLLEPGDGPALSRLMQRYVKAWSAGAFATPSGKDLAHSIERGEVRTWGPIEAPSAIAVARVLSRPSKRRDFTGREYVLPGGSVVVTHLAVFDSPVPDLLWADYVYAYVEDRRVTDALSQTRSCRAVRVSAASEIIACWAPEGDGWRYDPWDAATLGEVPFTVSDRERAAVLVEVGRLSGWHDDYPYYNRDGTWTALNLRGWKPEDPTFGLKPSEMSKAWWAEHPDADGAADRCDWTVLADHTPALRALTVGVARALGATDLERVRLLRLEGRGPAGSRLLRHTDITDRTAGTADGQIARFHLPLVTHPDARTHAWALNGDEIALHLAAGRLYYLDQRKPHMVVNASSVDRVHLVVDVVVNDTVRDAIGATA